MLDYRTINICNLSFLGLVEEAIGIGLGEYLLKTAILTAWDSKKIEALTVNTCSLDHKRALQLYQKNGFSPVEFKDFEKCV
jgi:GNAT superfamily N-acetyltransferase